VSRALLISALWLAALPSAADAQGDVLVVVDAGPLRELLRVELEARSIHPRFEPLVRDPASRAADLGAVGALWLEGAVVVAWSVTRPEGARVQVDLTDPAMVALVSAALMEELLDAPVPEPPLVHPGYHVPALGLYTGAGAGGHLRFLPQLDGSASVRSSLGLQWIEGFRIGAVGAADTYLAHVSTLFTMTSVAFSAGLEVGARLGDDTWAFHFGGHALLGQGRSHNGVDAPPPYTLQAGVYGGAGIWLDPRVELGLRAEVEVWEEPGFATTPVARLCARVEWR
jgi:hypothetical protein